MRLTLRLLLLICFAASTAMGALRTKPRLLLPVVSAKPGDTILVGVQLKMDEGWHTYWRNPGEAGGATSIKWTLPAGVTAGEIQWPVPEKYLFTELTTYVYHDEAVLLVPLKLALDLKPGPLELKAKVDWIECEQECIKGSGSVTATLNIASESQASEHADKIEEAKSKVSKDGAHLKATASWDGAQEGDSRHLILEWTSNAVATNTDFFSYENKNFDVLPAIELLPAGDGKIRARKKLTKFEGDWPKTISGIIVDEVSAGTDAAGYYVTLPIAGGDTQAQGTSEGSPGVTGEAPPSWIKMLLYAFLGGIILNVMPCVLPVITLKIFSFVQQSKEEPGRVFRMGLIYALGVLASFAAFAAMVISVQRAGGDATWGMQMQNPHFRMALTVLMVLVALNLFGLFEVILSGRATGAAATLASREGYGGAFFNGMLAVLLATPCTAPVLASAVGYAFTQSAPIIMLFFLTIGAGLAFPYVLLSWRPGWLRYLPKPGAWMEKFKIALGFPVLATAIWLFGLTVPSFSEEASWGFGFFLVSLALALWIWGQFVQRGSKRKGLAILIALAMLGMGYAYGLEDQMEWRTPGKKKAQDSWSAEAVAEARDAGQIVIVDFTAVWCISCKANAKILHGDSVQTKMKELGVVTLIADNTDPRPDIAAELRKHGRSGVPLVLVYPRDKSKPPIVMPTLFTTGMIMEALENAAK